MPLKHNPPPNYANWKPNSQKAERKKARKAFEQAGEPVPAWCERRSGERFEEAPPDRKVRKARRPSAEAPTEAPAPPVGPTRPPAPRGATVAPTPPRHGPLAMAVATTLISAVAFAAASPGVLGDYGLLRGLADYLLPGPLDVYHGWPGTLGAGVAIGVLCGKWVSGHLLAERLWEGRRDTMTRILLATIAIFLASEMLGAFVREVQQHALHVKESMSAVHMESPLVACPTETMPKSGVYGYKQIEVWQAGATARQKACMDAVSSRATAERGELVAATDQHSIFEVPLLMLWAAGMCLSTCAAAGSFGVFVRSLLAIPAAIAAKFHKHEPAPVPTPKPVAPPAAKEGVLRRWARWPFPRRRGATA